jgi:hypothetical protein
LVAELAAVCVAHPELRAVYAFESTFGGEGEAVVTVGLVLEDATDPEPFVTINEAIRPEVERLVQDGAYIFQLLDEYSLDRVTGCVSPIFERR